MDQRIVKARLQIASAMEEASEIWMTIEFEEMDIEKVGQSMEKIRDDLAEAYLLLEERSPERDRASAKEAV